MKLPNESQSQRELLQRRQILRLVLAMFLIWVAVTSSVNAAQIEMLPAPAATSQQQPILQADPMLPADPMLQLDAFTAKPIAEEATCEQFDYRPAYVQLYAELSNFDRDLDPDGWQALVVICNRDGLAVVTTARATFEILDHSRPFDRHATRRPFVQSVPLARWSLPLQFNDQGVAVVTLPASSSVQRSMGWHGRSTVHRGTSTNAYYGPRRQTSGRWNGYRGSNEHSRFVTYGLRERIDYPTVGWLRVRVSISGQRPLEAIAPIDTRPAVLVDIYSRYR